MFHRALTLTPSQLLVRAALVCLISSWIACIAVQTVHAEELPLPPRSEWRASSSAAASADTAPALAIDGNAGTRWGGAFTSEQWLQIDLGKAASIGGVLLQWDSNIAHRHSD